MAVALTFGKQPEKRVWVAVISHKNGENLYAAETQEGLNEQIAQYVSDYWYKDGPGRDGVEPPDDAASAVDAYFEYNDEEWVHADLVEMKP